MHKRVLLIFNPIANLGRAWPVASSLRPLVTELGGADWTGTTYPTHAAELAHRAGLEGYERVIALGGDGTVHEIANGLMELPPERRPAVGIVPVGTGNDFAHSLGVPPEPEDALRLAIQGPVRRVDLVSAEDNRGHREYWTNTLGIGFDAAVNIRSRRVPLFQGFLVYFIAVLQTILADHKPFEARLRVDGDEWRGDLLMLILANGRREGGGFLVAPQARQDDGCLEYTALTRISRARMLLTIPYFLKGTHASLPYARCGSFSKLDLESNRPLTIHADGEIYAGFHSTVTRLRVEVHPRALPVVSAG